MIPVLFVITAVSLVVGAVSAAAAWRTVQENRRRSAARVARLSDAIYAAEPSDDAPVDARHLFDTDSLLTDDRRRRLTTVGGAAALGLAAIVVVTWLAGSGGQAAHAARADTRSPSVRTSEAGAKDGPAADAARAPAVLDLVSLVHERTASGQLDLRGEVHNPQKGATLEGVTAVAMLFDRQGAYLASGRAPLQPRGAPSTGAATFEIAVPDAASAGSYRVSFRLRDRVIPHSDRRADREVSK